MMTRAFSTALGCGLALAIAACSQQPSEPVASDAASEASAPAPGAPMPPPVLPVPAASATASPQVLGLEGLGDLRIGKAVPKGSSWAVRGAQASDMCLTESSPDYPGAYAIVENGTVRRITLGQRSKVKLAEGIGVGDSEADVKKWFAGFRSEPHKYEEAPAKYLTAPNAGSGDPALRFEIDHSGRVSNIHVGTMPQLGYVEGCA